MNSRDITLVTVIFIVFAILIVLNILAKGIANIKRNWPKYLCNPMIMPFASTFGHDAGDNFTYCMQNIQSNYMSYLTLPINYNINVLGNIAKQLNEALKNVRGFIAYLRNMITEIIRSIFGVFLNILIEFQKMTIDIKDMFSKFIGIITSLMYIMSGSIDTMKSAWNGPPGDVVRGLGDISF